MSKLFIQCTDFGIVCVCFSEAAGQRQKRTVCILKMNEWEQGNDILRTKKLECSQQKKEDD